jgi:hypothetical protein
MALDRCALSELLDALVPAATWMSCVKGSRWCCRPFEAEAAQQIGAGRYERSTARTTHRNGSRARLLSTKAGDVELRVPKLREGSFFPSLLEPRRRIDRALLAVVMQAYVHGTSTRKVDDLVKVLAWMPGSPSPRSAASVPSWMPRWPRSAAARLATRHSRTRLWTPPTSRPAWTAGWSPGRS